MLFPIRITKENEKRNLIVVLGGSYLDRNNITNRLFNKLKKEFIGCNTQHYISMELARKIIQEQPKNNDPDEYWEDTFMKCQEIMIKPNDYKESISNIEKELEEKFLGGVVESLLKDTSYKNSIISTIKTNKELNYVLENNVLFIILDDQNLNKELLNIVNKNNNLIKLENIENFSNNDLDKIKDFFKLP